ncbi:MBL fold metallo-hydrolase [Halobacillus campisalis]|uniref:MBL fold metallo-hydrolase n=1 Tax=Halobacillus campisalis TaxID=435909 RepID=A0ABW2K514_9BACI|nr:MBL fold metallo-hydrolase [Halobacillus campisalis]
MSLIQINSHCYYYNSTVNIGYITDGTTGLLIDTGIDTSSVKKVERELHRQQLPLTHLFITHAHADHYGGAAYLQKNYNIHTIAPEFEAAILQNPKLEPLYLFAGNDPLPELQNKFLQGAAMQVDTEVQQGELKAGTLRLRAIAAPGHSYHQLCILAYDILFAADAYFSSDQLSKHKIPYITDAEAAIQSLKMLQDIDCKGALPGHGVYEEDFQATVQDNIDYHEKLLVWLDRYIDQPVTHESIVASMCEAYKVNAPHLSQWLLYRTAVSAYLVGLIKRKKITHQVSDFKWTFYPAGS